MRPPHEPLLPASQETSALVAALKTVLRTVVTRLNALSDGRISAVDNKAMAAPTTGTWAQGDFIRNATPTEQGSAGSKYVIYGWVCSVGGTPGTWLACRFLTGN